jgi:hypothetical protein
VGKDSGRRAARALHPGAVGKGQKRQGSLFCKFFDPRQSTLDFDLAGFLLNLPGLV